MDLKQLRIGDPDALGRAAGKVDVGDRRLQKRTKAIMEALARNPDATPPEALGSDADSEAYYRFLRNPRTKPTGLVSPHVEATLGRVKTLGRALAIYDQSAVCHARGDDEDGFYTLTKGRYGYLAHVGMAVTLDVPCPLGLLGLEVVNRDTSVSGRAERKRKLWKTPHSERESAIWWQMACRAAALAGPDVQLIHVMDREGDNFGTLSALMQAGQDFVIRSMHDRWTGPGPRLRTLINGAETILEREIFLSRRTGRRAPGALKKHAPRDARPAQLHIKGLSTSLLRPAHDFDKSWLPSLALNVVRAIEVDPPAGEKPVDWILLTPLPVSTPEEVAFVVDCYRLRWMIEELFAALKVGCDFNSRQLQSRKTSSTALALEAPVAVHLLQLRFLARYESKLRARYILPPIRLLALREHEDAPPLSPDPTIKEAMMAIAAIGGHLKSNGEPGWKVLGRGYSRLLIYERGFADALRLMRQAGILPDLPWLPDM